MHYKVYGKIKQLIPLQIKKKIRVLMDCLKGYGSLEQVDNNSIVKAMSLLSYLSVEEIRLSNTRRKDAEWWNQFNENGGNEMPVVRAKFLGNFKKAANIWYTSYLGLAGFCDGILDIDFDELYLLMVKSIARSYKKICLVNYGVLSIRLQKDLNALGIDYDIADVDDLRINHKTCTVIVDKPYDLVWCPVMDWFHYKAFSEDGKAVFFMPAAVWYMDHKSRAFGYEFEYDIALNIIPNMRKMGVDVIVLEDILKFKRDNIYSIDPVAYVNKTGDKRSYDNFCKTYPFDALVSSQGGWCVHGNFIGMQDYQDEYRECIAGERVTYNSFYNDRPNVYFIGPCIFWGGVCS